MPYKTTKNRLVNEVTLGDGYPLSNNLLPLKVGGETSPLEMSKQLPDQSDKAKVKVVGDLEVTNDINANELVTANGECHGDKITVANDTSASTFHPTFLAGQGAQDTKINSNLTFTPTSGTLVSPILSSNNGVCGGPSTPTKHFHDWHYYNANLATQNAYYHNSPVDDFGVIRNSDIADNNTTTLSNAWRMIRYARRVPYGGELTKFQAMIESTGAAADSDIEVSLWWADNLSDDTEYSALQDFTCDRLCTLTFDFSSATRFMTKQTTSFDEATIAEGDWLFVTLRKITSGDGSSFNAVVNALWTGV